MKRKKEGKIVSAPALKGPSGDTLVACAEVRADEFEPFGPESRPGQRVVDLFSSRVIRHHLVRTGDKEKDVKAYVQALDSAWGDARADHSCLVVASDAPSRRAACTRLRPRPLSIGQGTRCIVLSPRRG